MKFAVSARHNDQNNNTYLFGNRHQRNYKWNHIISTIEVADGILIVVAFHHASKNYTEKVVSRAISGIVVTLSLDGGDAMGSILR